MRCEMAEAGAGEAGTGEAGAGEAGGGRMKRWQNPGRAALRLPALVCRQNSCCDRPAPIHRAQAMHDRGEEPDFEDFYSTECFSCGYVCRCEV